MSLSFNFSGEYLLSGAFDGKSKVWSIERRQCVATHMENDSIVWAVTWLPRPPGDRGAFGRSEMFAVAGAGKGISFYREASGG
jgi:superkiller protein 8